MQQRKQPRNPIKPLSVVTKEEMRLPYLIMMFLSAIIAFLVHRMWVAVPTNVCKSDVVLSTVKPITAEEKRRDEVLYEKLSNRFGMTHEAAKEFVAMAKAFEDKTFPTHRDILAIVAVESSFNPIAENAGAYGLMQIQFGWHKNKVGSTKDLFDPWINMGIGAGILKEYYQQLRARDATVIAYQAGIGAYLEGSYTTDYLVKFQRERAWFNNI